jgi:hypothetical protein
MRRLRFRIASFLVVVVFLCLGMGALRGGDEAWDSAVFGIAILMLAVAPILAVHRSGERRAYWLGFALVGGTSLTCSLIPPVEARLPTTKLLSWLDTKIPGREPSAGFLRARLYQASLNRLATTKAVAQLRANLLSPSQAVAQSNSTTSRWSLLLAAPSATTAHFIAIAHSLLAIAFGWIGGKASEWIWLRERTRRSASTAWNNSHRGLDDFGRVEGLST